MRRPDARVVAFEAGADARATLAELANLNEVSVTLLGICDCDQLEKILGKSCRALVLIDVEGSEYEIPSPSVVNRLKHCDILVELMTVLRCR